MKRSTSITSWEWIKFSEFCEKGILIQEKITQKYLGLRKWNLQGIIFISTWTYKTIFKSALGYQGRMELRKLGYIISICVFPARESGAVTIPCMYVIYLIMYTINTVKTSYYMFVLYIISATFPCSNSTIETLGYVHSCVLVVYFQYIFTPYSSVSNVDFEQVNASWDRKYVMFFKKYNEKTMWIWAGVLNWWEGY